MVGEVQKGCIVTALSISRELGESKSTLDFIDPPSLINPPCDDLYWSTSGLCPTRDLHLTPRSPPDSKGHHQAAVRERLLFLSQYNGEHWLILMEEKGVERWGVEERGGSGSMPGPIEDGNG